MYFDWSNALMTVTTIFYSQGDFNTRIDDTPEKLNTMKLEQARYNQSKDVKIK